MGDVRRSCPIPAFRETQLRAFNVDLLIGPRSACSKLHFFFYSPCLSADFLVAVWGAGGWSGSLRDALTWRLCFYWPELRTFVPFSIFSFHPTITDECCEITYCSQSSPVGQVEFVIVGMDCQSTEIDQATFDMSLNAPCIASTSCIAIVVLLETPRNTLSCLRCSSCGSRQR